jgi:hypothetical protein
VLKKLLAVFIALIFIISMSAFVDSYAHGEQFNFKNPFKTIWMVLFDHEERITDLEELPPEAGIKVYDAEGHFLGFSTDIDTIYNPSLQRFLRIRLSDGDFKGETLFFETTDCSGAAYANPVTSYSYFENTGKYYAGKKVAPVNIHVKNQWAYYEKSKYCQEVTWGEVYYNVVPAEEIDPPINMPVALPLSFEIE